MVLNFSRRSARWRIANLTEADLKLPESQKLVEIEKLIRSLDSTTFRVRESAATRLLLLGEPALPHLQKALDKPLSLEQKLRVGRLKTEIDRLADLRRKELLLPKAFPRSIRPTFAIAPNWRNAAAQRWMCCKCRSTRMTRRF